MTTKFYWLELWSHVPGAGVVFPWRLKWIEELQARFKYWNRTEQKELNRIYDEGVGFTVMDWSSLFTNIPQFNPSRNTHLLQEAIGCFEVWSDKIHRGFNRHPHTPYIRVERRRKGGKKHRV